MSTNYVVKDMELNVLLAAAGVDRICSFSESMTEEEEKVPYLIHEMVRKGLVGQENDALYIASPYKELIAGIKNAKSVLTFVPEEKNEMPTSIYLGKPCIVIQDSPNDKAAVRMRMADLEDVMELLAVCDVAGEDKRYPNDLECPPLEE